MEGFICFSLSEQHSSQLKWFRGTSIVSAQVYIWEHSCGIETLWQCFVSTIFLPTGKCRFTKTEIVDREWSVLRNVLKEGKQEVMEIPCYNNSQMKLPPQTFHLEIQYRRKKNNRNKMKHLKRTKIICMDWTKLVFVCEPLGFHVIHNKTLSALPVLTPLPFSFFPLVLQTCPKFGLLSLRRDSHSTTSTQNKHWFANGCSCDNLFEVGRLNRLSWPKQDTLFYRGWETWMLRCWVLPHAFHLSKLQLRFNHRFSENALADTRISSLKLTTQ